MNSSDSFYFLSGGGEMGELTRSFDWSKTPVGNPAHWPLSLRTVVGTVLHSAFPMVLFWGSDFTCFYNDAYRPSLGYEGKHPAIGKKAAELFPEAWEYIRPILEGVFYTGEPVLFEDQLIPVLRDGKMVDVYWTFSYSPVYDDSGKINGVFIICSETTSTVLLAKANEDLEKSNAELAQFAYIASHDLQEPLRKISVFSQMLETGLGNSLDTKSKNYINKIKNASTRMLTLIRDVLTFSEPLKGPEMFTDVDLNLIIKDVIMDYELLIEEKKAVIRYDNLPVLKAVPLQMSQLFANLVGNSLKFAKKDVPPVVSISLISLDKTENPGLPNKDYIQIRFSDNGIGFKEEYAAKIFGAFQRLHRKSEYEGTGIGLAICKKIALNHGGDLNAEGSSENGAVFNLILPIN